MRSHDNTALCDTVRANIAKLNFTCDNKWYQIHKGTKPIEYNAASSDMNEDDV